MITTTKSDNICTGICQTCKHPEWCIFDLNRQLINKRKHEILQRYTFIKIDYDNIMYELETTGKTSTNITTKELDEMEKQLERYENDLNKLEEYTQKYKEMKRDELTRGN